MFILTLTLVAYHMLHFNKKCLEIKARVRDDSESIMKNFKFFVLVTTKRIQTINDLCIATKAQILEANKLKKHDEMIEHTIRFDELRKERKDQHILLERLSEILKCLSRDFHNYFMEMQQYKKEFTHNEKHYGRGHRYIIVDTSTPTKKTEYTIELDKKTKYLNKAYLYAAEIMIEADKILQSVKKAHHKKWITTDRRFNVLAHFCSEHRDKTKASIAETIDYLESIWYVYRLDQDHKLAHAETIFYYNLYTKKKQELRDLMPSSDVYPAPA